MSGIIKLRIGYDFAGNYQLKLILKLNFWKEISEIVIKQGYTIDNNKMKDFESIKDFYKRVLYYLKDISNDQMLLKNEAINMLKNKIKSQEKYNKYNEENKMLEDINKAIKNINKSKIAIDLRRFYD